MSSLTLIFFVELSALCDTMIALGFAQNAWAIGLNEANDFVKQYYSVYDANRSNLTAAYTDMSTLNFEGQSSVGSAAIIEKLTSLPFKTIQHVITTIDAQPTVDNGIIILAVGMLKTDDDSPHSFSEMFYLKKASTGEFVILNQIFRLALHYG